MSLYYHYWEVQIYNGIVKLIANGLLTYKFLLNESEQKGFPLFKVFTEFQYQKVITVPHANEIRVSLINLVKMIKETASVFMRWRPNTCIRYRAEVDNYEQEEAQNYSYLRDLYDNQSIKLLSVEIQEIQKQAFQRLNKYKQFWEESQSQYTDQFQNFKSIVWN